VSADDVLLVRRCLRGDASAVEQLIGHFHSDVFGLCVRLLQHRQDAEDVAQEVFLRVFRSLRRWDNRRPLKPWIMGIAVNRCRTWIAQRARRPELAEYLHETAARPEEGDGAEMAREIQAAVSELRLGYRGVFVFFHEQGLPMRKSPRPSASRWAR